MSVYKKKRNPNREWVLDPKNLDEIIRIVEGGGMIVVPPDEETEEERERFSKELAEYRAARAMRTPAKQMAYA